MYNFYHKENVVLLHIVTGYGSVYLEGSESPNTRNAIALKSKMADNSSRLFSKLATVLSKLLGLTYWKNEGKLKMLNTVYSAMSLCLYFSHIILIIVRVVLPLIVRSIKERGKVTLSKYSFLLVVGLTSITDCCIRFMYLTKFGERMLPIQTYMDFFDSLIHLPKKLQKKLEYFMVATDIAVMVLMIIRVMLICDQYLFYDKQTRHLPYFVMHVIEVLQ